MCWRVAAYLTRYHFYGLVRTFKLVIFTNYSLAPARRAKEPCGCKIANSLTIYFTHNNTLQRHRVAAALSHPRLVTPTHCVIVLASELLESMCWSQDPTLQCVCLRATRSGASTHTHMKHDDNMTNNTTSNTTNNT